MKPLHKHLESETLNAYLDGELGPDETIQFENHLEQNHTLRARLDELRRVRLLAQCAMYMGQNAGAGVTRVAPPRRKQFVIQALAAGLLVVFGFLAGLGFQPHPAPSDLQTYLSTGKLVVASATLTDARDVKAIYHISTANSEKIRGALDDMEILLGVYAKSGRTLHLEIIANAEGLNLLRADTSPARERVQAMQQTYKNLKFLACGKTIERLQIEKNMRNVQLLPGVTVVPSALDQVILRLEDGWSYIRV